MNQRGDFNPPSQAAATPAVTSTRHAWGVALVLFGLGLLITVLLASQARDLAREKTRQLFLNKATERSYQIRERLRTQELEVSMLARFLGEIEQVTPSLFERLAQPLLTNTLAITWVPVVAGDDRGAFERRATSQYGAPFSIRDHEPGRGWVRSPKRDTHYPILFFQSSYVSEAPLGLDMVHEPRRLATIERALRTHRLSVSESLPLLGPRAPDRVGIIAMQPVFGDDGSSVRGFVQAALSLHQILQRGFPTSSVSALSLSLYEDEDTDSHLYQSDAPPQQETPALEERLQFGDRSYRLIARPTARFLRENASPAAPMTLLAGSLVSALIAAYVFMVISQRQRALALVNERTQQLRAAERRWAYALDSAGDGVWDWHADGHAFYSRSWKTMLGYTEDEISDSIQEWSARIHPEDLPRAQRDFERHLRGESSHFRCEQRMRCKDGSWKWILSRGQVIERDSQGNALRAIGTHADISRVKATGQALVRINAELQGILDAAIHVAIIATDRDGYITTFNRGAELMLGYSAEEMLGREKPEKVHLASEIEARRQQLSRERGRAVDGLEVFLHHTRQQRAEEQEWTYVRKDGRQLQVQLMVTAIHDEQGEIEGFLGVATDITDSKRARAILEARDELLAKLSAQVPGAIYQFRLYPDGHSCFPYSSAGMREVYEVDPEAVLETAEPVLKRIHPEDRPQVLASTQTSAQRLCTWREEYRVVLPERGTRWLRGEALPEKLDDGSILWHGYVSDITTSKTVEDELRTLSITDPLTGVYNRRYFIDRLDAEIARAQRHDLDLALIMFDLDHFKSINDRYGHHCGDNVLTGTCERILRRLRRDDVLCRLGGEEFIVLCPHTDAAQAEQLAESLRQELYTEPFPEIGTISASFGVAAWHSPESGDALLNRTDRCVYSAKRQGRNRVVRESGPPSAA